MTTPSFSVIVPVFRGERFVPGLLAALAEQTVAPSAVWLAETDPGDTVCALAEEHGARYVAIGAGEFDHAGTRSRLARMADGELLVFLSQDVTLARPTTLAHLLAPFAGDATVAAAYGRQVPSSDDDPVSRVKRHFNYPERSLVKSLADRDRLGFRTVFISNAFAAYRRQALAEVGWFGERRLMCEDIAAAAALILAGHRIAYAAEAVVFHTHRFGLGEEFRRYFDIGVSHARQAWIGATFGRPGREGWAYLGLGLRDLLRGGAARQVPEFVLRCVLGHLAYSLGRRHRRLPVAACRRLSLLPGWWAGAQRWEDDGAAAVGEADTP